MEDKKPLLSICIPTYNRFEYLDKCLHSIVSQEEFNSPSVELVISDNASTDNTEATVKKYQKQYKNIFYNRNNENIHDRNHPMVIGNAHGIFRKLCNDTLIFGDGAIAYLLNIVKNNIDKKPVVFFLNHNKKIVDFPIITDSFDSFVKTVSFYVTWIGGFGIWEEDFKKIEDIFADCETHLWHTKRLFEIIMQKKGGIIDNKFLFQILNVQKKDLTYGLYKVFYETYLELYQPYLASKILSDDVFSYLRKDLLFGFFMPWIVSFRIEKKKYQFSSNEDIDAMILNAYNKEKYYKYSCLKLQLLILKRMIRKTFGSFNKI